MRQPDIVVAEMPGQAGRGQDRCRTADGLMIVLDGASAFDKEANPDASEYVDHLADNLLAKYVEEPGCDLAEGLAYAIEVTATALEVTPGRGPSSTVAVVRWGLDVVDTLVLGDSTIIVRTSRGCDRLTDDALAAIAPDVRRRYRDRLAKGDGFSTAHRDDLAELQRCQASQRNRVGGYWIAEACSDAAHHALRRSYASREVVWCISATDGTQRTLDHLSLNWANVAGYSADDAFDLLVDLHHWESHDDPEGLKLPRSKRHDDKTVGIIRAH